MKLKPESSKTTHYNPLQKVIGGTVAGGLGAGVLQFGAIATSAFLGYLDWSQYSGLADQVDEYTGTVMAVGAVVGGVHALMSDADEPSTSTKMGYRTAVISAGLLAMTLLKHPLGLN